MVSGNPAPNEARQQTRRPLRRSAAIFSGALIANLAFGNPALAGLDDLAPTSLKGELRYDVAMEHDDGDLSLSRLSFRPEAKWRFGRAWRAELSARLDFADDDTGLGTSDNFSSLSKPLIDNRRTRLELDRAVLSWRGGRNRISIGKQVAAWGVLDGVQITDRFDPVRRRDFIFSDVRPERLARWGIMARTKLGQWTVEPAIALDASASQQANFGDAFALQATRFTGGLTLGTEPLQLRHESRNGYVRDATAGLRVSRDLGAGRISVLAFTGPTTDPVLGLTDAGPTPGIELRYPKRSLVGLSWDQTLGSIVLRGEAAYIPDQPVNVLAEQPLARDRRKRVLAGVGLDWNAPLKLFVNAQLAVDNLSDGTERLARPPTDVIATVRVQRAFRQAGWQLRCEWIGSLNDGDGVVRPAVEKEFNDALSLTVGADIAFGDRQGQFGQFESRSRAWARLQLHL